MVVASLGALGCAMQGPGGAPDGTEVGAICGVIQVQITLCPDGTRWTDTYPLCSEVSSLDADCRSVTPPDEGYETLPGGCERRVEYRLSRAHELFEPVAGTCEEWELAFHGAIDCFNDRSCPDNQTCQNGTCHCGGEPLRSEERDPPPVCEGDELVIYSSTCSPAEELVTRREVLIDCTVLDRTCGAWPEGRMDCV